MNPPASYYVINVRSSLTYIYFLNLAIGPLDIRADGKGEEFRKDYRNLRKALCVGYASQLAERKMHHNGYRTLGFQSQVVQVIKVYSHLLLHVTITFRSTSTSCCVNIISPLTDFP